MGVKLTKATVDKLSLPEKGQAFVWDSKLSGFGIRLTPTRKTFIAQARVNGKSRRVTLGVYGIITADKARDKALKILGEMAEGKDPLEEKNKKKTAKATLREVADLYMDLKRTKKGHPLKQATKNDIDRHIKTTFADWKDKPLASITRDMVNKRYQEALKTSEAQAVQGFRILRAIYNWQRNNTKDKSGNPTMPENPCMA
ncbi:MAG: Arm DNA-binding domain-containing protein, partial [Desulfosalsimonas sp.]|uniref:Arm DNA-binding domain-containing protein n=1 Tax=Desulfosalsimonas sp. TaxID=3073848 RepID=UPI003970BF24